MENSEKKNRGNEDIYGAFKIGNMEVVINVKSFHEVVNFPEKIIQMPLAPDFLLGVFNLRGLIIPIINLKALLKFTDSSVSPEQKVGIVEHQGARIGLLFDSTSEILRIKPEEISEFVYHNENSHQVISGAIKRDGGNRILQVINPFALISIENIPQIIEQQKKHDQQRLNNLSLHEKRSKCISFAIHNLIFGMEITGIHEIIKVQDLQDSAMTSKLCLGMVNLRGNTVPVIDLSVILRIAEKSPVPLNDKRIIILKIDKELFGLLVDSVESINTYIASDIMPIPLLSKTKTNLFRGCLNLDNNGEILMLNEQSILSNEEIVQLTQGHSKIYNSENLHSEKKRKAISRQSYISFRIDHHFGVSIKDIREIINFTDDIIAAPGLPAFIKGLLNLRGKLVTVVDTRALYGMESMNLNNEEAKILIFESGEERIGLIVDSIESILSVDEEKKMKVPELMVQKVRDQMQNDIKEIISFMLGEKDSVLIVLDMDPVCQRIKKAIAA